MNNIRYLLTVLSIQCKLDIALKLSFLIKVGALILKQGLFIIMWGFFFNKYLLVDGWNFSQMLAMYGLISFGIGFVETVFYGIRDLPSLIDTNQIDNYLVQPRNVLLGIALSKGDIAAFTEAIYGLGLLLVSGYLISDLFWLLILLPLSIMFIFSLYLYLSSVAFFLKNSHGFVRELYQNANIVATQPNSAYRGMLKFLTLTVLPTAYLSFFPIEFLRTHSFENILLAYVGTIVFLSVACFVFYKGLARYESGSNISYKY